MPTISEFYGIRIVMHYIERHDPHCHVEYTEYCAEIRLSDRVILGGNLPNRAYRFVTEWMAYYPQELRDNWQRICAGVEIERIPPMPDEIIRHPQYPDVARVVAAQIVSGFTVHLKFADGVEKDINLEPFLHGPIFEPIRNDPQMFAAMFIDNHTIAWRNGADIDPDTLYFDGPPPWAVAI